MNARKSLLAAAAAFFATAALSYADVTIVLTGSTAFRAAVNDTIKIMLSGEVVRWRDGSTAGLNNSNNAIFQGTIASLPALGTVTIQTAWSGSGSGITTLVNNSNVSVLPVSVLTESPGTPEVATSTAFVTAKANYAFSDVKQESTTAASLTALGAPTAVGIIPFLFVASESAPAGITNITDQQVFQLLNAGFLPASVLSGNNANDPISIFPIGRDAGSGTRIAVLAETGYGINNPVNQANITASGTNGTLSYSPTPDATSGNGGESSGQTLATELGCTSNLTPPVLPTDPKAFAVIGYVGVSDATTAQTNGARWLTYNGAAYSPTNVKNGVYTLWSEVQLYTQVAATSADQTTLRDRLVTDLDTYLLANETRGIALTSMRVSRPSDGGPVSSNL